jgi:hypothetical protein
MDMDDFDLFDDWSETGDFDSSDTWDEADEEHEHGAALDPWDDDDEDDEDSEDAGGWAVPAPARAEAQRAPLSAWEVGAATGIAGWLLDQQADRIAAEIRAFNPPRGERAASEPLRAWQRLTGPQFEPRVHPLTPGDALERSRLVATLTQRMRAGRPLCLEARLSEDKRVLADRTLDPTELLFTVVITDLTPTTPIWVMFEERPAGFSGARLQPVFDGTGPAGRAYCFPDHAEAAVRVIEWGLERHDLDLSQFKWAAGF